MRTIRKTTQKCFRFSRYFHHDYILWIKKHWTHLETVPFRGASNIKIIISSIILLNRFLHQYSNDIFQFAVDTFKIRHHIFIFAKSLVLLPRVFINIGIYVFVCIRVFGIIYSTTIPSEIFCIIVEYL